MSQRAIKKARLDLASTLTLIATLILFAAALFETGIPHTLSLEAGVLLVSLKLVLSARRAQLNDEEIVAKLDALLARRK